MGLLSRLSATFSEIDARLNTRSVSDAPEQVRTGVGAQPVTLDQLMLMLGGGPTKAGVVVNERNALQCVAVFAATRIISDPVGTLPILIYKGDEDDDDHALSLDHPARSLLRFQPNEEMTAVTWKQTIQAHVCLRGNGYSRLVRDGRDNLVEIRPLDPSQVRPERTAGQLTYACENGDEFEPEEILHIAGLGFDGVQGYSPIGLARQNLGLAMAAELYGASFFGNGSHMSGLLTSKASLSPDKRREMENAWREGRAGMANAGKDAVLDGDWTYTRLGIAPEEAQFLETRKFSVLDIARLYRVPPHMLADMEKASFASIEQMGLEFLLYSLMPWLTKWEQEINRKILGLNSGYFAKFDVRQLLRGDMAAQQAFFASGIQWGYLNRNEVRQQLNRPKFKVGDEFLQPVNMAPAGTQPPSPASPNTPEKPTTPAAEDEPDKQRAVAIAAMTPTIEHVIGEFHRRERAAVAKAEQRCTKPGSLEAWQSDFYTDHDMRFRAELGSQVRSLAMLLRSGASAEQIEQAVGGTVALRCSAGDAPTLTKALVRSLSETNEQKENEPEAA